MPRYVALLRGVNVGGSGRMAMADLRACVEGDGFEDVTTHIQTGNVLFRTPMRSAEKVAAALEKGVAGGMGFRTAVMVRTAAQLTAALDERPFPGADRATLHIAFLREAPRRHGEGLHSPGRPRRGGGDRPGGASALPRRHGPLQAHRQLPGEGARRPRDGAAAQRGGDDPRPPGGLKPPIHRRGVTPPGPLSYHRASLRAREVSVTHPWRALVACIAVLSALVWTASAAAATKVSFVQGEQNVFVTRPGDGLQSALQSLLAGPTAAERKTQIRTYIAPSTPVLSVTQQGAVATVDLGDTFVAGNNADTLNARLSQLVATVTAVPGVTSVQVLIDGGVPLGLFPGIDATGPLTVAKLRTPSVAPPPNPVTPSGPVTGGTKAAQQRLADLGYLLPGDADGRLGPATTAAVIAFQKWEGLQRDGVLGPKTLAALGRANRPTPITQGGSGRRLEVLVDKQLALAIQDNRVVRALHVSSGKPSTPTPIGSFKVYAQYPRWWSTPFQEWLLWASPFVGGVATHQYPDVPVYAASHGCVRVPAPNAPWLYRFLSVGDPVRVLATS